MTVTGSQIESAADQAADFAGRTAALLEALAKEPCPQLDVIAVFNGLSVIAAAARQSAGHLLDQDWTEVHSTEDPEMEARWAQALSGLDDASALFKEIADGWI